MTADKKTDPGVSASRLSSAPPDEPAPVAMPAPPPSPGQSRKAVKPPKARKVEKRQRGRKG